MTPKELDQLKFLNEHFRDLTDWEREFVTGCFGFRKLSGAQKYWLTKLVQKLELRFKRHRRR